VEENLDGIDKLPEPFESVPFDDRAALESAGMPVGANDLLIASIALAGDFVLVTREMREFRRVAGLRPEEW
jgi:tRNA(fMet)-specific endonuclease VapC